MKKPILHFDWKEGVCRVECPDGPDISIHRDDVSVSYYSRGSGGQHLNRHMSGVRLAYRIPVEFRRKEAKTKEIITRCIAHRSQHKNYLCALDELGRKLAHYFTIQAVRKHSKVPGFSKVKRLHDKKLVSQKEIASR
ncbi:hypothetical protein IPJ72_07175 [Candidatus Peregrinibacteria bacterium]|nr:MAG: hypothetical protein IPJ72_07175 [Candidatus Peregrinibacteria bacterium]